MIPRNITLISMKNRQDIITPDNDLLDVKVIKNDFLKLLDSVPFDTSISIPGATLDRKNTPCDHLIISSLNKERFYTIVRFSSGDVGLRFCDVPLDRSAPLDEYSRTEMEKPIVQKHLYDLSIHIQNADTVLKNRKALDNDAITLSNKLLFAYEVGDLPRSKIEGLLGNKVVDFPMQPHPEMENANMDQIFQKSTELFAELPLNLTLPVQGGSVCKREDTDSFRQELIIHLDGVGKLSFFPNGLTNLFPKLRKSLFTNWRRKAKIENGVFEETDFSRSALSPGKAVCTKLRPHLGALNQVLRNAERALQNQPRTTETDLANQLYTRIASGEITRAKVKTLLNNLVAI